MIEWILVGYAAKKVYEWAQEESNSPQTEQHETEFNDLFQRYEFFLFSMLGKIASSDGKVCQNELERMSSEFKSMSGVNEAQEQLAHRTFQEAQTSSVSIFELAEEMRSLLDEIPSSHKQEFYDRFLVGAYRALWEMAAADKILSPQEDQILRDIPSYLGISPDLYEAGKQHSFGGPEISKEQSEGLPKELKEHLERVCLLEFSIMGKLAKADGRVSEAEIAFVDNYINEHPDAYREHYRLSFSQAKNDSRSIFSYAQEMRNLFDGIERIYPGWLAENHIADEIYGNFFKLALADGILDKNEEMILKEIPAYLGLSLQKAEQIKRYATLNSKVQDSNETIKANYEKLVKDYHPDLIQSKGLPEAFMAFANQELQKINGAYAAVMKERGVRV